MGAQRIEQGSVAAGGVRRSGRLDAVLGLVLTSLAGLTAGAIGWELRSRVDTEERPALADQAPVRVLAEGPRPDHPAQETRQQPSQEAAARQARGLSDLDYVALARDVIRGALRDDIPGLSAELAYRFFLTVFPFAIFLAALGGFVAANLNINNPVDQIINSLGGLLPSSADAIVRSQLEQIISAHNASLWSISALFALFFATGGMNAIIKALNRVYEVPEARPIWRRYVTAIFLTLIGGAGMVVAFILYGPVQLFAPQVAGWLGLGSAAGLVVNVIALVGAVALVIVAAAIIYRLAPNLKLSIATLLPGAVIFALVWLIATLGFAFYVANFGSYANTYGALAGVAILMIWFYLSSLVFLVAAEVNATIHAMTAPGDLRQRQDEANAQARQHAEGAQANT